MNTNHNRIKIADLETNEPNKTLVTNDNGELAFNDIPEKNFKTVNGESIVGSGDINIGGGSPQNLNQVLTAGSNAIGLDIRLASDPGFTNGTTIESGARIQVYGSQGDNNLVSYMLPHRWRFEASGPLGNYRGDIQPPNPIPYGENGIFRLPSKGNGDFTFATTDDLNLDNILANGNKSSRSINLEVVDESGAFSAYYGAGVVTIGSDTGNIFINSNKLKISDNDGNYSFDCNKKGMLFSNGNSRLKVEKDASTSLEDNTQLLQSKSGTIALLSDLISKPRVLTESEIILNEGTDLSPDVYLLKSTDQTIIYQGTRKLVINISNESYTPFEIGNQVRVIRNGVGEVSVQRQPGVTLIADQLHYPSKNSSIILTKIDSDTWTAERVSGHKSVYPGDYEATYYSIDQYNSHAIPVFVSSNPISFNIPSNTSDIDMGTVYQYVQKGDGIVTLVANGNTLVTTLPLTTTKGESRTLTKIGVNTWQMDGTGPAADDMKLKSYTVSTLPVGSIGDQAYVTDAVSPAYLVTLTGGGTTVCPVFYNGTAWVSH